MWRKCIGANVADDDEPIGLSVRTTRPPPPSPAPLPVPKSPPTIPVETEETQHGRQGHAAARDENATPPLSPTECRNEDGAHNASAKLQARWLLSFGRDVAEGAFENGLSSFCERYETDEAGIRNWIQTGSLTSDARRAVLQYLNSAGDGCGAKALPRGALRQAQRMTPPHLTAAWTAVQSQLQGRAAYADVSPEHIEQLCRARGIVLERAQDLAILRGLCAQVADIARSLELVLEDVCAQWSESRGVFLARVP